MAEPIAYEIHELALLLPRMSAEEFQDLCETIRESGQDEPIRLFEGKVLDGRHRYEACLKVGKRPETREFEGDWDDAVVLQMRETLGIPVHPPAAPNPKEPATINELLRATRPARVRRGSVLTYARVDTSRHPTEKPVALLGELIRVSSEMGTLVLDPFAGSGSVGEACLRAGRRFVGIELDPSYAQDAAARLTRSNEEPVSVDEQLGEVLGGDIDFAQRKFGFHPAYGTKEEQIYAEAHDDALDTFVRQEAMRMEHIGEEAYWVEWRDGLREELVEIERELLEEEAEAAGDLDMNRG